LIGVRGIIIDPIGQLVEYPIRGNFKEGITLVEFLLSCYGARKGIVDTALRTARAGYLTRRLVDIAHFQIISIRDCGTRRGVRLFSLKSLEGHTLVPFTQRRNGRALSSSLPGFGSRNSFYNFDTADKNGIFSCVVSFSVGLSGTVFGRNDPFGKYKYE
jgi:DNA-directed RNA polymerase subunit beta'